jgi:hypothetical protein
VVEFIAEFEQSAHNMLLYNLNYDETYFVTWFLAGLKEEIRSGIVLHRPPDVDTVIALALLQEAELGKSKTRPMMKGSYKNPFRSVAKKVKAGDAEKPKQQALLLELKPV